MTIVSNLIVLPSIILKVVVDVLKQKRFISKHVKPKLNEFEKTNDGTLDKEDFQKITSYYGFGVPAVLAESFATLRGYKLTQEERWASTCQGAATGLFDDMFDKKHLSKTRISALLNNPQTAKPDNSFEKMFLYFYKEFLKHVANTSLLHETMTNINASQEDSLDQTNENILFEKMLQTTYNKGGNSVLFYRALLAPKVSEKEKEALYEMGALMQMGNDIFDVYKDSKDGVKTIMNSEIPVSKVWAIFRVQMNKAFLLLGNTEYSIKRKTKVMRILIFGISRVFVALEQYQKLEDKMGGKFDPIKCSRKELICDMEKPKNMLRSIAFYLRYSLLARVKI